MQTTLISGTSKGIGKNLCNFLLNKNHKIISISRSELDYSHKNLYHIKKDITDTNIKKDIENVLKTQRLDNCILNAGSYKNSFFHKMSYEDWHSTINLNICSLYNVLHPVINHMRQNEKGNIIFTSSVLGNIGSMGSSSYACSKSSLHGLTKSLVLENSSKNILINTISPGYIDEGMGKEISETLKKQIINNIPLKQFGNTTDINELIYFLIEKNKYITGSNIHINGGLF
jgi:3-oxoacyl-[acyl-carrier protein] reductase